MVVLLQSAAVADEPTCELSVWFGGGGFGECVALDEDFAVVGAPLASVAKVFVRVNDEWQLEEILTANDAVEGNYFGRSVAISGDLIVVGSAKHEASLLSGAAYVFRRDDNGWF